MTVPPTMQLQLHTKTIRVCSECALEPPRHQHFCSAVGEYSRSQILRELVERDDAIARLTTEIAAAGGDDQVERDMRATYVAEGFPIGPRTPLLKLCDARASARFEFWEWAWWLGLEYWNSPREAKEDVLAEVAETRARLTRKRLEDAAA